MRSAIAAVFAVLLSLCVIVQAQSYRYTSGESGSLALGTGGAIFEDGTTAVSGETIFAIHMVADATFTTLTPVNNQFIGTAGGSGDAIDTSNTFTAGSTIFGEWTAFTLNSGSVIAYTNP